MALEIWSWKVPQKLSKASFSLNSWGNWRPEGERSTKVTKSLRTKTDCKSSLSRNPQNGPFYEDAKEKTFRKVLLDMSAKQPPTAFNVTIFLYRVLFCEKESEYSSCIKLPKIFRENFKEFNKVGWNLLCRLSFLYLYLVSGSIVTAWGAVCYIRNF